MADVEETTFKNPAFDPDDDDDDVEPNSYDDDAVQESLNTTQPFNPGQASTPYQWQTMQQEHAGLPSYDVETPLLQQQSWDVLTSLFPNASATDLETSYGMNGRLQVKMASAGKKLYDLYTKNRSGEPQLNPRLSKEILKSLGEKANKFYSKTAILYKSSAKDLRRLKNKNVRQKKLLQKEKKNCER